MRKERRAHRKEGSAHRVPLHCFRCGQNQLPPIGWNENNHSHSSLLPMRRHSTHHPAGEDSAKLAQGTPGLNVGVCPTFLEHIFCRSASLLSHHSRGVSARPLQAFGPHQSAVQETCLCSLALVVVHLSAQPDGLPLVPPCSAVSAVANRPRSCPTSRLRASDGASWSGSGCDRGVQHRAQLPKEQSRHGLART